MTPLSSPCSSPAGDTRTGASRAKGSGKSVPPGPSAQREAGVAPGKPGRLIFQVLRGAPDSPSPPPQASAPQTPGADGSSCIAPSSGPLGQDPQQRGRGFGWVGCWCPGGTGAPWRQRGPCPSGRGAVTWACRSPLTGTPAGIRPIVWRTLIGKGRRLFSQTSANPRPRPDLGFPRGGEGRCREMGPHRRGQALLTHRRAGASSHGIMCLRAQVAAGPRAPHHARGPPSSAPPPPRLLPSAPPSCLLLPLPPPFLPAPDLRQMTVEGRPSQPTGGSGQGSCDRAAWRPWEPRAAPLTRLGPGPGSRGRGRTPDTWLEKPRSNGNALAHPRGCGAVSWATRRGTGPGPDKRSITQDPPRHFGTWIMKNQGL